jgi:hypothetical protein
MPKDPTKGFRPLFELDCSAESASSSAGMKGRRGRGQAVPDRPGQQGSGGAPGHGGPPRLAGVQEGRLVKEGNGRRVPGSGLQKPTGAITPERVPEEVPSMVRGGAPGEQVLGPSFAPLAQWAGCEST